MVTIVGTERGFINTLGDLMALDQDAIAAYEAAISRIDDAGFKARMQEFKAEHDRHVTELRDLIARLGGAPAAGAGLKSMLTQGKVAMGALFGDKAILKAMKSNEDDTNTAYERALKHKEIDGAAVPVLERGLADERRHLAWIEETLAELERRRRS
jgi:uncharacterized protein (TIGR02284 family)